MPVAVRIRLSILMLLQYFTWGAWYVTMGTYLITALKANAVQVGAAYANLSVAAMISPFFVGMVADRFFAAQHVLGVLHIIGAGVLFWLSVVPGFNGFWWLILLYTLLYMPTMSLANSISFRQMTDAGREFPSVRVFGTVGWIIAGLLIGSLGIEATALPFRIAAACSLLLGIYSFSLPPAPPVRKKVTLSDVIGLDALVLFKDRRYGVFFITAISICIPLAFYYSLANPFLNDKGMVNAAGKMTLGQVSEMGFMLLMPFLFSRLGVKKMMLLGMGCWIMRYVLFALGNNETGAWMLYAGILLHGVCYDFFFVTGQIYTNHKAGEAVKSAAQGLITFATYGVGMLIGSYVSGFTAQLYSSKAGETIHYHWASIWLVPAVISGIVLIFFACLFKDHHHKN
ncbi:nucleoside transporter [Chitinophaga polysaccharea]|uniref:Nucleoside transporter n=1 Tax=Chitinophaga polysaccharea TaxID=1293035 RepID=A0A561PNZ6_9BACT|nr:nucleoside permease [Chitinophaga polysaccharea]TWF39835.1 nucleoside transporter [Chitinophaga polysaccharea]